MNSGRGIHRQVFFISNSTGITVEMLGNTLPSQFDHVEFATTTIPFVTDAARADKVVARIDAAGSGKDARHGTCVTVTMPHEGSGD